MLMKSAEFQSDTNMNVDEDLKRPLRHSTTCWLEVRQWLVSWAKTGAQACDAAGAAALA